MTEIDNMGFDLDSDFNINPAQLDTNSEFMGNGLVHARSKKMGKILFAEAKKKDTLIELIRGKINKTDTLHILSNCNIDGFSFVPALIELYGYFDLFYGSTWTINHRKIQLLDEFVRSGKLKSLYFLTDPKMRDAETSRFALLKSTVEELGGTIKALKNHVKITLLQNKEHSFVVTGSANYTANPRIEQFTLDDDKKLFTFYENWFKRILEI